MRIKSHIHKTVSLFLAFWMFFASAGMSVNFHYCEGEIVDWSIFVNNVTCDHEEEESEEIDACCKSKVESSCDMDATSLKKSSCCDSDKAEVIIEGEFKLNSQEIEITQPVLFLYSYFLPTQTESQEETFEDFLKEKPPISTSKKLATLQCYLL